MSKFLISLLLVLASSYTSYITIKPLFFPIERIDKVLFSDLALPFIATWGVAIFSVISFYLSLKCLIKKCEYKNNIKLFYLSLFLGSIVGLGINYSNYFFIIKPKNMVECPKKLGYKKNLMHEYVIDVSQCEKF